jgi:Na+-translocating ferredoxin:NAD+ oxidoreductase subunit B
MPRTGAKPAKIARMSVADSRNTLARRIDALLPQTQCTRCGYPACLAYAEAIARDEADINQCPPGGEAGIVQLASLLGRESRALNPENGTEKPAEVAFIDEEACIGCTKCIQVCPIDAIVGAQKLMHAILADECSGCELCLPACPVDCISMIAPQGAGFSATERAPQYRRRYDARKTRLTRERVRRDEQIASRKAEVHSTSVSRNTVLDAIARAKARKENKSTP